MRVDQFEAPEKSDNPFFICDAFIRSTDGVYLLAKNYREKFEEALALMFETINKMENDEEIEEDFSFKVIEECINFISHLPKERSDTDNMVEFIRCFLHIAFNLNENLTESEVIREKIINIQRYYDNSMTYVETLKLMRTASSRLSSWRDWSPPSFRLSEHYYNLIKGE